MHEGSQGGCFKLLVEAVNKSVTIVTKELLFVTSSNVSAKRAVMGGVAMLQKQLH